MRTLSNYQTNSKGSGKSKKSKSSSNSSNSSKKSSGKSSKKSWKSGLLSPVMIKIYGIIFILFAVLSVISIVSYYFTNGTDRPYVELGAEEVANWCGALGAYIAFFFVDYFFGFFSIGFPFLFFLYGVKMTFDKTMLPLVKTTVTALLTMACFSMILALFLPETYNFVAGTFGSFITQGFLVEKTGVVATFFILLTLLFILLILCYNLSTDNFLSFWSKIHIFKKKGKKDGNSSANRMQEDDDEIIDNQKETELQKLPDLYITGRNELSKEYDKNVIHFEAETGTPTHAKPENKQEETEVPLDIVNSHEMAADNDLSFENDENEEVAEAAPAESDTTMYNDISNLEDYDPRKDLSQYHFPTPDLLFDHVPIAVDEQSKMRDLRANKEKIEKTLKNFGIPIQRIFATVGPTVTLYEIVPAEGVRISKIKNLEDDIALNLAALGIRIIAPIPGKGTIGIEVPNSVPQIVPMKDIITSEKFLNNKYDLPIGLGKTISDEPFVVDLAKMPHLLMAGATGQGKSVGLNAVIASLLYKKHPAEIKFVLIDPKKVEFTLYSIIENHYLATLPNVEEPIITDTKKVIYTLNSLCAEMDARYDLLKYAKVRNIKEYNAKFCSRQLSPTNGHRYLPYIVLIIDEFGDLIMTAGRSVETPIARLAQLARAIGIHLVIATQRPSVNIITGIIKANFPSRIAFRVSSKIDSRTILDCGGADQLIGKGDMLLSTGSDLVRLQCAFIDTPEVEELTKYIADQQGYPEPFFLPEYSEEEENVDNEPIDADSIDPCFMDAATLIVQTQQGSTSMIQRKMKLGYNRAGRIMDQMEEFKIVGSANGSKVRQVNVKSMEELREIFQRMGLI